MKCFFALSSKGWVGQFQDMALVLAKSAQVNSTLDMFCIYDGQPNALTDRLTRLGVRVLFHKPRYSELLEEGARRFSMDTGRVGVWTDPSLWNGTFLRLEIPLLMDYLGFNDKFVLYVDADVFFQLDPALDSIEPAYLAAASERDANDATFFNAGVLLLNVSAMLKSYPRFIQFCIDRNFTPRAREGVVDQGLYNTYYRAKWLHLGPEYNWKAYWPPNPQAAIVHFHGPKPALIAAYLAGEMPTPPSLSISRLLAEHSEHLATHLEVWRSWLVRANNR
jgi:hypothetical protein